MEYLEWNDSIARHFFNEENAGKEVLLYVNDEILKEIGKKGTVGVDDFVEIVKKGPPWVSHSGLCQKALQTFECWRARNLKYPPYISYLACFVLAAGIHGDFAPHAYYPRLRKLLGESDNTSHLPSFDKMILLWDDLEKWSVEDKHEEWGRFVARIRGGWWKVGLPLSQTIISTDEQKQLHMLFDVAELDPSAPPSQQVMLKIMRYHGSAIFEKRTLKVLDIEKGEDVILKNKLVEMVLDELEGWDGTVKSEEDVEEGQKKKEIYKINSGLRICLKYDPLSKQVKTSLRLKTNGVYPEDGLIFKCRQFPETLFYCEEAYQGWSKKIKNEESEPLDAASIDWINGVQLQGQDNNWRATLKGGKVRLFVPGKAESLSGWIEVNRLNRGIPFLVAASEDAAIKIRSWGESNCESFEDLKVDGLPHGWLLFKGLNASDSCEDIDVLSVSSFRHLLLRGGVKIKGGNTYLYNAPPLIVVENVSGDVRVTVNGKQLKPEKDETQIWKLPYDIQPDEILRIEAKAGGDEARRIIRLAEPHLSNSFEEAPWRDARGRIVSSDSNCTKIRGSFVNASGTEITSFPFMLKHAHYKQIVYIGNTPGQIALYPKEPFPAGWKPVWAMVKKGRKKWKVLCCRKTLDSIPSLGTESYYVKSKEVKRWKKYVWMKRKQTDKPEIPAIRQKWIEFSEAAQNV